jgi:hypothetical protein
MPTPSNEIAHPLSSPDGSHAGADATSDARRHETRSMVIKSAKIVFGQSCLDCVVLDVSPGGARFRTNVVVSIPETVIVRFSGGSAYLARVQWARGTEFGLAFERAAPLADDHAASVALSALSALPMDDLEIPMRLLRASRFFDDPGLTKAAEEAERAYACFKAALKERIKFLT